MSSAKLQRGGKSMDKGRVGANTLCIGKSKLWVLFWGVLPSKWRGLGEWDRKGQEDNGSKEGIHSRR